MSSKSFWVGAVTGALVYAGITWLLSGPENEPLPSPFTDAEERRLATPAERPSPHSEPDGDTVDVPTEDPGPDREREAEADPDDVEQYQDGFPPTDHWLVTAYERLEGEPKDDAWAYNTEQAILQFFSRHPGMTEFEIGYIECRTTLCQIRVNGYAESSTPTWSRIIRDLNEESWAAFGQRGWSAGEVDGLFVIIQDLHRR